MSRAGIPALPAEEELRGALGRFVARSAGASEARVVSLGLLSGGAIQQNWAFEVEMDGRPAVAPTRLVMRTDSLSTIAASRGRAQEFALLAAAHGAGVAVPEPLWLDADGIVTGRPMFVMRWMPGIAAGHRIVKAQRSDAERAAIVGDLGRQLARIHAIRPPRADLRFLGSPPAHAALASVATMRQHLDELPSAYPATEYGLRWLETHAPSPNAACLVHRDFRTGNFLLDAIRVAAILDWEFAGWGDRLEDIGWFCARCWRFGEAGREAGGIGDREDFYRAYELESGLPVDRRAVSYWEAMAHARWAVIAAQQAARCVVGGERSLEIALTGRLVPAIERDLLLAMEEAADA